MPLPHLIDAVSILKQVGLRPSAHVADFGCGRTGHFVFPAAHIVGQGGVVFAVDVVKDAIAMVEGKRKLFLVNNLHTVWGDFEREGGVNIAPASLDWIFVVNNVWCVKDLSSLCAEMRRLLKPDGRVLILDWKRNARHPIAPPKEARKDAMQVEAQFLKAGLVSMRELNVSDTHWGLVLRLG